MTLWKKLTAAAAGILTFSALIAWAGISIAPPWAPHRLVEEHVQLAGYSISQWLRLKRQLLSDTEYDIYRKEKRREDVPRFLLDRRDQLKLEIQELEERLKGVKR